jgi:acyl-CoA synthetase (NDP forming)
MKSIETIIANALAEKQNTLTEYDSKRILAEYGIPTSREFLAENLATAEQAADNIGYPLALKVCAAAAQHKTEMGLIELGIKDAAELKRAYDRLVPKARDLGGAILVQEMIVGSRELVMGMVRDPQFGPCVMFGLGGIFTEAPGRCRPRFRAPKFLRVSAVWRLSRPIDSVTASGNWGRSAWTILPSVKLTSTP